MKTPTTLYCALALLLLPSVGSRTVSAIQLDSNQPQPIVARCGLTPGVLLGKSAQADWQVIREDGPIRKDMLLVALPDAKIYSGNKAVTMTMLADLAQRGPLPVFESAVVVHENPNVDMDVTLDRGIVALFNAKKRGSSKVKLRFFDQTWLMTLHDPGTTVGMELFGRHAAERPAFVTKNGKVSVDFPPTINVNLLVLKGNVTVLTEKQEVAMDAPPGPAKMVWDNVDQTSQVIYLAKLPPTLLPMNSEEIKLHKNLCGWARKLEKGPIDKVLEASLESEDPYERSRAVVVLGALDRLPRLVDVLAASQHADARDKSIVVLRNFIGRGPGQIEKVYDFLITKRKLTDAQARTALHLLIGFDEKEKRDPLTYEVLIDLLGHSKLAVRELARWHLIRLVPEGKKIMYDAGWPPEDRQRARAEWRALVPVGQLPPHLRQKKNN